MSTTTRHHHGIDCSPEALAGYRRQLAELEAMYFGGAASVSDRNRSVTFRSHADLGAAMTRRCATRSRFAPDACGAAAACSTRRR